MFPFSILYASITNLRNYFYDIGYKKSHCFEVLLINVGNLRIGGTGKTPISELIIKILDKNHLEAAYLSRGYGRKSKGYVEVKLDSKTEEVGDESLQIKHKFPNIAVAVCEKRAIGIPYVLTQKEDIDAIILDDAFQHRSVFPHLNILLTSYLDLFVDDYVLPLGRLRESRKGAKRADLIIVTKCPDLLENEKEEIRKRIRQYSDRKVPILFSGIIYEPPIGVCGQQKNFESVLLLSAIANNDIFYKHCSSIFKIEKHYNFLDHHDFTVSEIKEIVNFSLANNKIPILTTEKDWQRLKNHQAILVENQISVLLIPISVIIDNEQTLWKKIVEAQSKI